MTERAYPKLKPEYQGRTDRDTFEIRLRTPAERREYERKQREEKRRREKDWPICGCCGKPDEPQRFRRSDILVCDNCVYRGAVYGRSLKEAMLRGKSWELNAATAVIREIVRECRNSHNRSRDTILISASKVLTLLSSPKT